jgi:hypothetical protein
MTTEPNLSKDVLYFIDCQERFDGSIETPQEREDREKTEKIVDFIVDDIISSRESLTSSKLQLIDEIIKTAPELIESFLDARFTHDVVTAVPGYVRRLMHLSRVEGTTLPSSITNGYMREAVRTYVLGLPQASIALSRAALEQAIKERLGRQLSGDFITFQDLLKEARKCNILDDAMKHSARFVANAADDVLHERPSDLPKALKVLDTLRGIFRHVYSTEGGY